MANISFVGCLWADVWVVRVRCAILDGDGPGLTPVIVSVRQLVADDGSDSSVVHRPGGRNDVSFSSAALAPILRVSACLSPEDPRLPTAQTRRTHAGLFTWLRLKMTV